MGKNKKRKREDDELYNMFKKFAKKLKKRTTKELSSDSETENDVEAKIHGRHDLQETYETCDNIMEAPDNIQEAPDNIQEAPENIQEAPYNIQEAPDNIQEAPDNIQEAPDNIQETPNGEACQETPEAGQEVTEESNQLDEEILSILGEDPNKKIYASAIHKDIVSRWNHITGNGVDKETKTELCKKYPLPENCLFLEPPKVNAEVKAAVSEQVLKRDKVIEQQQSSLGVATACIGKALDILIKSKENKEATKILSDAGRMMCDLFHSESMSRRYLLQFALNKNTKDIVTQTKVGKYLFGDSLHDDLKAGKAINKTGLEIKSAPNKQIKPATTLNSRGPPRRYRPQYTPSAGNLFNKPQTATQRWPAPQRGPTPQRWPASQRRGGPPQKKT